MHTLQRTRAASSLERPNVWEYRGKAALPTGKQSKGRYCGGLNNFISGSVLSRPQGGKKDNDLHNNSARHLARLELHPTKHEPKVGLMAEDSSTSSADSNFVHVLKRFDPFRGALGFKT